VCEADPYSYLVGLSQAYNAQSGAAKNKTAHAGWAKALKDNEARVEGANAKKANEVAMGRGTNASKRLINPISLFEKLENILPQDSILVADGLFLFVVGCVFFGIVFFVVFDVVVVVCLCS